MTLKIPALLLIAGTVVCLAASPLCAIDIITKKNDGKRVNGTISAMTKTELTLKKNQGDPEIVAANNIAAIEWEGGGGDLKLGYSDELGGRYESATQRLMKAKSDIKSPSEFLKGELEYVLARVAAKQALSDPDQREQAIQKILAAQKAFPDHVRFYESQMLLSQLYLAAKDFDAVRTNLEKLTQAPWDDVKLAARIVEARALMAEGKPDEAIKAFQAVADAAGDSPADASRKYEAMLGLSRGLIEQSKFEEALKILDEVTEKGPADDSTVQAEAYTLQGHAYQGLGRTKEAALAYLHVDILFPRETAYHAESLYQMSILWKLVQHPDRSAEAAGKLVQMYPNSEWRKKLAGQ
ncbi:tetratricopeptide repeat protein [Schlesneria sp. T3-172]|uniref:tetratricopeptide repeat protein n=1 Tax=Schlesneria TaxID=656899 RepID=UPI002EF465D3